MSENVVPVTRTGPIGANVPPTTRRSRLNSVATVDLLVQDRSIWLMLTGVAVKLTGVAGKTVAEEMSEATEDVGSEAP